MISYSDKIGEALFEALTGNDADLVALGQSLKEFKDKAPRSYSAVRIRRFLEGEVLQWFDNRKKELANRPLIREQAFGEALRC
jgi:hypothetical protein